MGELGGMQRVGTFHITKNNFLKINQYLFHYSFIKDDIVIVCFNN